MAVGHKMRRIKMPFLGSAMEETLKDRQRGYKWKAPETHFRAQFWPKSCVMPTLQNWPKSCVVATLPKLEKPNLDAY